MTNTKCSVKNCCNPKRTRNWCNMHYERWRKHGDPLAGRAFKGAALKLINETTFYTGNNCVFWPFGTHGKGRPSFGGGNVCRIICQKINGPPPTKQHEAAHSCGKGNLGCITPNHIRWATDVENKMDMIVHGTRPRGETHGCVKLTKKDVLAIRKQAVTQPFTSIAKKFDVSPNTISNIFRRKKWNHIR